MVGEVDTSLMFRRLYHVGFGQRDSDVRFSSVKKRLPETVESVHDTFTARIDDI